MSDNLFLISSKQLRQADFSGYVLGVLQGSFNTLLNSYIQSNGFLGSNILYITGGAQNVNGDKTFLNNLLVRYSGTSGSAPSQQYVIDNNAILQSQINTLNLFNISGAHLTGVERFLGQKYFDKITINSGNVTGSFSVPSPINSGDAVPLIYLQNQVSNLLVGNLLNTTGNQTASGNISFFNGATVYVPTATNLSGAIPLSQLDSTGNNILNSLSSISNDLQNQINNIDLTAAANVTGFGGVLTLNAQSGNIFTQGRGNVVCSQNGNILNISGDNNLIVNYYTSVIKTGSGLYEQFVNQNFTITGWSIGVANSGSGIPLTGNFYQRASDNTQTNLIGFSLSPAVYSSINNIYNNPVTVFAQNRIGIDLTQNLSGSKKLTISIFGITS